MENFLNNQGGVMKKKSNKIVEVGFYESLRIKKDTFTETLYYGETIDRIPDGKGKTLTYDLKTHELRESYDGNWKNGVWQGYGSYTKYLEEDAGLQKDGLPYIFEKYEGKFNKGKKEGVFKVYDWMEQKMVKKEFKNDKEIKKKKSKK